MNWRRSGLAQLFAGGVALLLLAQAAQAVEIKAVTSPKSIPSWLMEDTTDSMISFSFSFRGGDLQDPKGKEGLTDLMVGLLSNGAGDLDRDAFEEKLYATGARLSLGSSSDSVNGSLRILPGETQEPLELLALALNAPRFDQTDIDQAKGVILASLEDQKNDPDQLGWKKFSKEFYEDNPRGATTTAESIAAITRDDLVARHKALLARSNLYVGVAGNMSEAELVKALDQVFGDLPATADVVPPAVPSPNFGITVHQPYDRPQTSISAVYPGLPSSSEDIYAANVLAHLLGGGMTSRLFHELREKRGLTYGAGAYNSTTPDWGLVIVSTNSRADSAVEALTMAKSIMKDASKGDISQTEVDHAKSYLRGSIVLDALDSTSQIASTLVSLQRNGRPIDYLDKLDGLYEAVTLQEVKDIAANLLSADPAVLIVGQED